MSLNTVLKAEVDNLMQETGLIRLLEKHGKVSITGSYVYDLMAWKDFDIVLEVSVFSNEIIYKIVEEIGCQICPDELKILNNSEKIKTNRPQGYWLGVYIKTWKIDLWIMDKTNAAKEVLATAELKEMLKDINKAELIAIKEKLSQNPDYHKKFSSFDLYNSYVHDGVRSEDEFYKWLELKNK